MADKTIVIQQTAAAKPQIERFVDWTVLDDMPPEFKQEIEAYLSSELFGLFSSRQCARIKEDIANLNPENYDKPEDFYKIAKDMRLILRFWSDLGELAKENSRARAAQQTENEE